MKLKLTLSFLFATMITFLAKAQESLPVYTDYLTDNYYLVHPSMAGASNCSKVRMTGRQLWFGQEDAPRLMTLNGHSRIGDSPSAVGAIFFTDKNGYYNQTSLKLTYAHHIMFSRSRADLNMLSFGLNAGFIQYGLDETTFTLDGFDPIISGGNPSVTNYNVDFGFSYHFLDFYIHGTFMNLLSNAGVNETDVTSNVKRYLFSTGGVISKYGSEWSFEPSVMYQYRDLTKESSLDMNAKAYKDMDFGKIWAGVSFRVSLDAAEFVNNATGDTFSERSRQVTPIFGVNYNKFMFAYNYTYQANQLVFVGSGFHQLTLGYDFNCSREPYDCKCPAVN